MSDQMLSQNELLQSEYQKAKTFFAQSQPSFREKYGLHISFQIPQQLESLITDSVSELLVESNTTIPQVFCEDLWDMNKNSLLVYLIKKYYNSIHFIHVTNSHTKPLHITLEPQKSQKASSQILCILVEEDVTAHIFIHTKGDALFLGQDVRVITKRGASAKILSIQNTSTNTTCAFEKRSFQHESSSVDWFDLQVGGLYVKSNIYSLLQKPLSETTQKVLYATTHNQQYDLYTAALHMDKQTKSDIVTKGVITDTAKTLSQGLVQIQKNAWDSQGYEQQDALLLSDTCEADAIPNLEIHNHDVSCSHGSTVGKIDEEKLFYLQSRGFTEREAKSLIVKGYFTPILDQIPDEQLRDEIEHKIDIKLSSE